MPGICAVACATPNERLEADLAQMLRPMQHHAWYRTQSFSDARSGAALGCVTLGHADDNGQPARNVDGNSIAMLSGELYSPSKTWSEMGSQIPRETGSSDAWWILHGYQEAGERFLRQLHGSFSAVVWNAATRQLVVTNDHFGLRPLYYVKLPGKLLVASEIKSLLAEVAVSRQANQRGLSQFFTYGHLLGEDTLLECVHALPPATCLVYDAREDRLTLTRYWQLESTSSQLSKSPADFIDSLETSFQRAVDRRIEGPKRLGISLSGGLDSRSILAAIDHRQVRVTSISLGVPGSLDHRCARRLAELSNRDHHEHSLDIEFLSNFEQHLNAMVHLTDGHYLDQCIVLPTLPRYRELGIQALLRGHAGELLHMDKAYNFSLDREGLAIRDESALESWLQRHLRAYMLEGVDQPLLTGLTQQDMAHMAEESLRACLTETASFDVPLQRIWHLFITQRLHRETSMSLAMFGSVVESRVPFLDNQVVEVLMAMPPEMKLGDALQMELLRRRAPAFLNVVNSNTGSRLGAGEWRRKAATLRMKVLAKLGVRGYQPYERLGLWLRRELRPLVTEILLDSRCLERGVFRSDTVRQVVQQHFDHRRNHTFLLMALMIFELGQRKFVDGDHQLHAARPELAAISGPESP